MRIARMLCLLTAAALTATGCASSGASGSPAAATAGIRIEPSSVQLKPGGTTTFHATVTGTAATAVGWSADCGSITPDGVYTAPQTSRVCRVTATSEAGVLVEHALVSVGGWAAVCAAEPEPTANVVYACDCVAKGTQGGAAAECVPGSDDGDGTKTSPFRSWSKVQTEWRKLPAGGTLALCRGGRWDASSDNNGYQTWRNTACSASAPCTLRDYTPPWAGSDDGGKPILADAAAGHAVINMGPADSSGHSWYRFLNLRLWRTDWSGASADGSSGFKLGPRTTDIEVCNCDLDGFSLGGYVYDTAGLDTCTSRRISFRGNRFLNNCTDALLVTASDVDVDGNYFDNNGHNLCGAYAMESRFDARDGWPWGPTTHTVYFSGSNCPIDRLAFRNNEVHRNAVYQGYVQGSAVKIKSRGVDVLVENNLVDMTPAHPSISGTVTAITVGDDGAYPGFDRMTIRRNRIPSGPGRKISVSSVSNLLIEDNLIWATGTPLNHDEGIVISQSTENRPTVATIRNNTLYYEGSASGVEYFAGIRTAWAGRSGPGQVVTGNSITIAGGGGACIQVDDPSKVAFMDNNQCSGAAGYATTDGHAAISLASWRSKYPAFDAGSITPPVTGLFENAPTDLTPAAGSPLIGAASTLTTCTVAGLANQACTSRYAIDAASAPAWSTLDVAVTRASPDIGAVTR